MFSLKESRISRSITKALKKTLNMVSKHVFYLMIILIICFGEAMGG
jgi:hypothetical protein